MSDFIELIQPYIVGVGLVLWELFVGVCFWASVQCENGLRRGESVSRPDRDHVNRASSERLPSGRSNTTHVPSTSA